MIRQVIILRDIEMYVMLVALVAGWEGIFHNLINKYNDIIMTENEDPRFSQKLDETLIPLFS